ncbi:MAG: hypothetical protein AAFP92_00620, partial [Bacteroidota bacterium]
GCALSLGLLGLVSFEEISLQVMGYAYLFLPLISQFVIYEKLYPGEYYFYFNLGWEKLGLWLGNFLLSLFVGILLICL